MIARALVAVAAVSAALGAQMHLVRTMPMPGVQGRIDHLAYDPATQRLFVAALGNGSLEVVDLAKGERIKSLGGLREPQGVVLVPAAREVLVACGGGELCAFDADLLAAKRKVTIGEDADNVRLWSDGATVLVGLGAGTLAFVDSKTLEKRFLVELPAHPESFQVEAKTKKVWVNVPGAAATVALVDGSARSLARSVKLQAAAKNYPMCLDEAHRRVFVGCRAPARVVVLDAETGKEVAAFECVGDTDDMFVDPSSGSLLVIGGGGSVDAFTITDELSFPRAASVPTAAGARTGLLVPERRCLYVAAPAQKDRPAGILEIALGPSGTTRPSSAK